MSLRDRLSPSLSPSLSSSTLGPVEPKRVLEHWDTLSAYHLPYKTQTTATGRAGVGWGGGGRVQLQLWPCLRIHQLLLTPFYSQPPDCSIAFYLHIATVQQLSLIQQPAFSLEWMLVWEHLWTEAPSKAPASPTTVGPQFPWPQCLCCAHSNI